MKEVGGQSEGEIKKPYPSSRLKKALAIRGGSVRVAKKVIEHWLQK